MDNPGGTAASGPFEARYLAFLETITTLRPNLHRYCARMTGSVLDGEDVVQEALFEAYRKLDQFDDLRPLAPWLFRIAHNRCIDFLRRRSVRHEAELAVIEPDVVQPVESHGRDIGRAVEHLVLALPPKERACVLLKDIFDYTLEEIAELVDSSVGGVKAALNRGRLKLAKYPALSQEQNRDKVGAPALWISPRNKSAETSRLLHLYVERFNRRDWDGLRELIADDARVRVADRFEGRVDEAPYFGNYARRRVAWQLAVGEVDGAAVVVILQQGEGSWVPQSCVRLEIADGRIQRIVDFVHCPWVLGAATSVAIEPTP
jgi:RNA polymerase sigma-70 factor (ECF subfamily)